MALTPCPCGRYQIEERESICPYCGQLLVQFANTQQLSEEQEDNEETSRWGTSRFQPGMNLIFRIRSLNRAITIPTEGVTEMVLGRQDPDVHTNYLLLDTIPLGGIELGVSRRHASIVWKDPHMLQLVDHGSANGTFLNGQRLIPNQLRIMRDKDEIRLGKLVLTVHFQRKD